MPRYAITVNILEVGRGVQVVARSKGEALAKVRLGEWDTEVGATDPQRYHVSTYGCVTEIPRRTGDPQD